MDFYVILGVERAASPSDVKRAYRRLARKHHPDINPGDAESEAFFLRVTEAYETLVDPERRQDYDQHGVRSGGPAGLEVGIVGDVEFEGFDFSGPAPGGEWRRHLGTCLRMCSLSPPGLAAAHRAQAVSTSMRICVCRSRTRCAGGRMRSR